MVLRNYDIINYVSYFETCVKMNKVFIEIISILLFVVIDESDMSSIYVSVKDIQIIYSHCTQLSLNNLINLPRMT